MLGRDEGRLWARAQKQKQLLFLAQRGGLQAVLSPVPPTPPALGAEGGGDIW